jgi:hypothetical protein
MMISSLVIEKKLAERTLILRANFTEREHTDRANVVHRFAGR